MKEITLTQGHVTTVSDKDFERVSAHKWFAQIYRRKDGTVKSVYARRNVSREDGTRTTQKMHRFILGIINPEIEVDHEDHNGLHNWRNNLRTTLDQNNQNARLRIDNTSGFKGVYWHKRHQKWEVWIYVKGNKIYLGQFSDLIDAARAYDAAALLHHGTFAMTNVMLGLLPPLEMEVAA
jgi:hypothetical protein